MAETNDDPMADMIPGRTTWLRPAKILPPKRGTPLWLRLAKIPLPGPGKILPWRKSGRINRRRLFEKVFGKRLCFHCQSAPRQILGERHSDSERLCQIGLHGVRGVSRENERPLLQPFQTRFDANRKSGGEDRKRQGIGFKRTSPGTMGRCHKLWREFR
jgi:hypothetical protein